MTAADLLLARLQVPPAVDVDWDHRDGYLAAFGEPAIVFRDLLRIALGLEPISDNTKSKQRIPRA